MKSEGRSAQEQKERSSDAYCRRQKKRDGAKKMHFTKESPNGNMINSQQTICHPFKKGHLLTPRKPKGQGREPAQEAPDLLKIG